MKAVFLAAGLVTRLSDEIHLKPMPMVEVGGIPLLSHILKISNLLCFYEAISCFYLDA